MRSQDQQDEKQTNQNPIQRETNFQSKTGSNKTREKEQAVPRKMPQNTKTKPGPDTLIIRVHGCKTDPENILSFFWPWNASVAVL